jgi:cytochrome c biogenesis protein CcmG/thiol:disulfide interchange protein DsbE
VPETYVLDRAGNIRFRQAGPITPVDLETKIRPLLAELKR